MFTIISSYYQWFRKGYYQGAAATVNPSAISGVQKLLDGAIINVACLLAFFYNELLQLIP